MTARYSPLLHSYSPPTSLYESQWDDSLEYFCIFSVKFEMHISRFKYTWLSGNFFFSKYLLEKPLAPSLLKSQKANPFLVNPITPDSSKNHQRSTPHLEQTQSASQRAQKSRLHVSTSPSAPALIITAGSPLGWLIPHTESPENQSAPAPRDGSQSRDGSIGASPARPGRCRRASSRYTCTLYKRRACGGLHLAPRKHATVCGGISAAQAFAKCARIIRLLSG